MWQPCMALLLICMDTAAVHAQELDPVGVFTGLHW